MIKDHYLVGRSEVLTRCVGAGLPVRLPRLDTISIQPILMDRMGSHEDEGTSPYDMSEREVTFYQKLYTPLCSNNPIILNHANPCSGRLPKLQRKTKKPCNGYTALILITIFFTAIYRPKQDRV